MTKKTTSRPGTWPKQPGTATDAAVAAVPRFVRPGTAPPLSANAMAMDRLRRAFNAVRDAQEMLERLVRKGPVTLRATLRGPIEDLDWTAGELSTALLVLQEATPP